MCPLWPWLLQNKPTLLSKPVRPQLSLWEPEQEPGVSLALPLTLVPDGESCNSWCLTLLLSEDPCA